MSPSHHCATLLLASNVHPKMVQSLLEHSSIEITLNTYSHVLPEMQGVVVAAMDEILEEPSKP
jgi:integrase